MAEKDRCTPAWIFESPVSTPVTSEAGRRAGRRSLPRRRVPRCRGRPRPPGLPGLKRAAGVETGCSEVEPPSQAPGPRPTDSSFKSGVNLSSEARRGRGPHSAKVEHWHWHCRPGHIRVMAFRQALSAAGSPSHGPVTVTSHWQWLKLGHWRQLGLGLGHPAPRWPRLSLRLTRRPAAPGPAAPGRGRLCLEVSLATQRFKLRR